MAADDPEDRACELFARASQGDDDALTCLLQGYLPRLRGYVRVQLGTDLRQRLSADDIVQSVCRELVEQKATRFPDEEHFRAWLYAVASSKVREHGRFHRRDKRDVGREVVAAGSAERDELLARAYASVSTPSREVMAREGVEAFESALASLREEHRTVIALARIARLPHAVIAEQMGRSVPAVQQLLARALLKLAQKLERV